MSQRINPIPALATDEEERAFWKNRDSNEYLDWSKAAQTVLLNLKPSSEINSAFPYGAVISQPDLITP